MKPRRFVAGLTASLLWAGGCASILDVEADEYVDAADVLCKCAKDLDKCKGQVEGAIESDDSGKLEGATIDCLQQEGDTCAAVYSCVGDAYCSNFGKRCALDNEGRQVIACCGDLACGEGDRCCAPAGAACEAGGAESGCCKNLQCDPATSTCKEPSTGPECRVVGEDCTDGAMCCSSLTCGDDGLCVEPACLDLGEICQGDQDCCENRCFRASGAAKVCTPN